MWKLLATTVVVCAFGAAAGTANAGVSEVRFGALAHDPLAQKEDGIDINAEIFFSSWTQGSWALRPSLGASVNTTGDTSQVYIAINYGGPISEDWFLEISGGGMVHDGELETPDPNKKELGSEVLFHIGLSLGVMVSEDVSLSLFATHASNAGWAERNEGLETAGLRLGIRF
jgi:lipid A 3-O-deacylase